MKIIEITFTLASGGAERFAVDLSNELAKNNNVTLLSLKNDRIECETRNFYKYDISDKVKYESLGLKDGLNPSMWWKIYKYIKLNKPDIVHFHGDGMPYWMLIPMILLPRNIQFVQTIHSDIHNGYDNLIYKIYVSLLGNNRRVCFVALSQTNYNELLKTYPKILAKCIVNGRAPMQPSSEYEAVKREIRSYKSTNDTKIFLHVARCCIVKNQKRLISTFNQLSLKYDAELLILGNGYDSDLGQQLKQLANNHIHFLGLKKNVADYQLLSDAFCLSSDFEGMPISIIEALLSGTPVVSTPVCGAVDAIKDGYNGVLSKDFSEIEYYNALTRMFNECKILRCNTQDEINNSPYSIQHCAKSYIDFFKLIKS